MSEVRRLPHYHWAIFSMYFLILNTTDHKVSQLVWRAARGKSNDEILRLGVWQIPYLFREIDLYFAATPPCFSIDVINLNARSLTNVQRKSKQVLFACGWQQLKSMLNWGPQRACCWHTSPGASKDLFQLLEWLSSVQQPLQTSSVHSLYMTP